MALHFVDPLRFLHVVYHHKVGAGLCPAVWVSSSEQGCAAPDVTSMRLGQSTNAQATGALIMFVVGAPFARPVVVGAPFARPDTRILPRLFPCCALHE